MQFTFQIYEITVTSDSDWISIAQLVRHLQNIESHANNNNDAKNDLIHGCVSLLTSAPRRNWGQYRETLRKSKISIIFNCKINPKINNIISDKTNTAILAAIDASLFVVCLDSEQQNSSDLTRSAKEKLKQILCGGGPFLNGGNRWFDKTCQVTSNKLHIICVMKQ